MMVEPQLAESERRNKLMQPDVISDGLKRREDFAVSLRKQKKK